ncbi:MAG: GGDEF domain-containing protein [Chloroflexota bacterium]
MPVYFVFAVVILAVFILLGLYIRKLSRRNRLLEQRVAESLRELAVLSRHLQSERVERRCVQETLARQVRLDALTGLYNRRYFYELARVELNRALRYQRPIALLLLDLDHFRSFNDRYGHTVGDEILIYLSGRLRECLRSVDLYGRYGGEEFIVMMPETDLSQAKLVAERIRMAVERAPYIIEETGDDALVTVSIGVVDVQVCSGGRGLDWFVSMADQALDRAKQRGRNRVETLPAGPEDDADDDF